MAAHFGRFLQEGGPGTPLLGCHQDLCSQLRMCSGAGDRAHWALFLQVDSEAGLAGPGVVPASCSIVLSVLVSFLVPSASSSQDGCCSSKLTTFTARAKERGKPVISLIFHKEEEDFPESPQQVHLEVPLVRTGERAEST